jgi:hypothetical protein
MSLFRVKDNGGLGKSEQIFIETISLNGAIGDMQRTACRSAMVGRPPEQKSDGMLFR